MLRIISFNLNGIRSAAKKGYFNWLPTVNADVICMQETKSQEHQLTDKIFCPQGYHCYYVDAEKKGYSGVAIYSKRVPDKIITKLGFELADSEGRYVQADFGDLSVASIYLPSGTSGEHRQTLKYHFMEEYEKILVKMRKNKREYIICGDWNIAHKQIDLKNWKSNQKNSGFLPEERAWLDKVFDKTGYMDAFRLVNQQPDQYTWWSFRARAREKNVGWRIDYQIITPGLKSKVKTASIYKDQYFSDHAPLVMDYDI